MHAILLIPLLVSGIAAWTDLRARRIPNWLTFGALALGLAVAAGGSIGSGHWSIDGAGVVRALAGVVVAIVLFLVPVLLGGMGAGDLKLMVALGAWIGPRPTLEIAVLATFIGGGMAVVMAYRQRVLREALKRAVTFKLPTPGVGAAASSSASGTLGAIPFGVAIAAGMILWTLTELL